MRLSRRILLTCLAFFLFSQILFLVGIQYPATLNFDEFHYVPSAKEFLSLSVNRNWEHPPLGKELMAIGIAMFGDEPLGWRYMSTFFGSLTLVGVYLWGLAIFRNEKTALWVGLITLANQILYVQSRIGMLDTFMMGFLSLGLAAFFAAWDEKLDPKKVERLWATCGAFIGFAIACKWTAIVGWGMLWILIMLVLLLQFWQTRFERPVSWTSTRPGHQEWYSAQLWKEVRPSRALLGLGLLPLLTYFVTFLPFLWVHKEPAYTFLDLLKMQPQMFDGQLRVVGSHPYMSEWKSWALMLRPIWYAFEKEGESKEWVRGVICLGNPLVMWAGLVALGICAWSWVVQRSRAAFLIVATYSFFYFCWAVVPRKVSFYYYYYPAALVLSLALGFVFHHWEPSEAAEKPRWARWAFFAGVAALFIYFYPILSASKIPAESFRKWTWFRSWI